MKLKDRDTKEVKKQKRLEVATILLQGQAVPSARDGYDPMGFGEREMARIVRGALDMADQLLIMNDEYDDEDEDPSPWCAAGHRGPKDCDCGPIAENE